MPRELNRVEQILEMFGHEVSIGRMLGVEAHSLKNIKSFFRQFNAAQQRETIVYDAELESFR